MSDTRIPTCPECGCFDHSHGGCQSRGHDENCHGIHTVYACGPKSCPCCVEVPDE